MMQYGIWQQFMSINKIWMQIFFYFDCIIYKAIWMQSKGHSMEAIWRQYIAIGGKMKGDKNLFHA